MQRTPLEKAQRLLIRRRFSAVIELLEPLIIEYSDSFDYFYVLGTACLYVGDIGGAELYYKKARTIKLTDVNLIMAQALLFLRRGDVPRAIDYYLQVQEYEPTNSLAKKALAFIKKNSGSDFFNERIKSGRLERFYPRIGVNPRLVCSIVAPLVVVCCLTLTVLLMPKVDVPSERADLSELVLSVDEKNNALEQDTASSVFKYVLTEKDLENSYEKAIDFFQNFKDNSAQIEINRILYSNASASIKQKARLLEEYLEEPSFNSEIEVLDYATIKNEPWLFINTWVVWSGRLTNVVETDLEYRSDFLIGYDNFQKVEGIIPVVIKQPVYIDTSLSIQVLGQIKVEDGRLRLDGKSIYQPMEGKN